MRVMICGSRTVQDKDVKIVHDRIALLNPEEDVIMHGGATGIDTLAQIACGRPSDPMPLCYPLRPINPNNKAHYLYRNVELITMCDKVIAFWDGKSTGTKFVIDYAKARGKPIEVILI